MIWSKEDLQRHTAAALKGAQKKAIDNGLLFSWHFCASSPCGIAINTRKPGDFPGESRPLQVVTLIPRK